MNIDPDLRRKKNWKFKLQRKSRGKWRKVGIYRTRGKSEIRKLKVKKGKYRVKVYARPGYRKVTTKAYRFTPTTPDTTAPGVVTGLAVTGRTATSITLGWTNPADPDLATVIVRRATGNTAPATPADGAAVPLASATAASVTDAGLQVDAPQSYAVFTRDTTGNTSPGVPLTTRTLGPSVKDTTRVSVRSNGDQATGGNSLNPAISADGRWISYHSDATNLVANDTNGQRDVFLHDRDTGTTRRVSVRSNGDQANGSSYARAISADGRWITYQSDATNLVDGDTNSAADVFLFDRDTGQTERVSVRSNGQQADGPSGDSAISADGRWITYTSYATNLVDNDTNGEHDLFLLDRDTGQTERVSVRSNGQQADGPSGDSAISADGRWITYQSYATNLVDNDTNTTTDVFLFDRDTARTERVSVRSNGAQANDDSYSPAISADGRRISYHSWATNLVANDTNSAADVFLFDRDTAQTERVSVRSNGAQADNYAYGPAISADGRWISYYSWATNLVDGDTNSAPDVFLFDRYTRTTRRVSVRGNGDQANGSVPAISADGRWITYQSDATNLVANDTNNYGDVFLARMW